jgi:hypothetical protein
MFSFTLVVLVVILALTFDYINGVPSILEVKN